MNYLKFDTLTKKSCALIVAVGFVMAFISWMIMPSLFYRIMNAHISKYITSMLSANTISQCYVWNANSTVFNIAQDEEIQNWIVSYYTSGDTELRQSLKAKILENVKTQQVGIGIYQVAGKGAIVATSYYMIYTEGEEPLYWDEAAEIASVVLDSGWLSTLTENMDMIYSPVLGDPALRVICFAIPFTIDGRQYFAVHMMDFVYILNLFYELEKIGIHDFCLLQHDHILYENSDYQFNFDAYPEYMSSPLQHETRIWRQPDGMDFITLSSYEGENLKIAVHADQKTLLAPYKNVILLMECVLTGIIFLLVILIILLIRNLLKRLTVLDRKINRVTAGNYSLLPDDLHHDEISNMTQNFNLMIQAILHDIDQKVEQEKREQQMQYSLLVSAIDPHFIYNTLNIITFLAHMKKTDEIISVNTAIIGTLKDRLAIKNLKTYDTIESEREVLAQYMLIQSYLCHNTIDYTFEVQEADLNLLIPKNILQPLIENSIKHGLLLHKDAVTHKPLDGKISVQLKRKDNALIITINDNGIGISDENIQKYFKLPLQEIIDVAEIEHIGIYNIRKRLNYLYGEEYRLEAQNLLPFGCSVTLILPLTPAE